MSKTDDQLRSDIDLNETRAEYSALAVFAGLIFEVLFALARSFEFEIGWDSVGLKGQALKTGERS